ncbi:MAG: hypothetical protein KAT32_04900 [Candidatus Moranbacteria bacterium]|nr:hypothetical protein [Candidatus Moranbacteria bacterium]
METEILMHKIEFSWSEDDMENRQLDQSDIDHIKECIEKGYGEGELCQSFTNYDKKTDEPFDDEARGWWAIAK